MAAKAARNPSTWVGDGPAWSISRPASMGPRKLAAAGAMPSQLNTVFSSAGCATARPTWRCSTISAVLAEAPVSSAARHSMPNTGHSAAAAAPTMAISADSTSGSRAPPRSAMRPAGSARNSGASANSASSTPTAEAL